MPEPDDDVDPSDFEADDDDIELEVFSAAQLADLGADEDGG